MRGTVLAVMFILLCSGCDTGLSPLNEPAGFSGVIRFKNWPPPDSVLELRVVAFKTYPDDSSSILTALLLGNAVVYPPVGATGFPFYRDSLEYEFTTKGTTLQAETYNYVALAWRYGINFFADWRPACVYTTSPGTFDPAPVRVLLHKITRNVDIEVDYQNLPPKPWQ